jgi:hypothetical protein
MSGVVEEIIKITLASPCISKKDEGKVVSSLKLQLIKQLKNS